jgi:hypothetical protein
MQHNQGNNGKKATQQRKKRHDIKVKVFARSRLGISNKLE